MARRATNSQQCEWCKWIQKLDGNKDSNCIDARLSAYQLDGSTPRGNNNVKLQVNERDQVFAVFTDEQNPAADMVTARPMRSDLGLCETCDIAKSWFEECENHPECQKTGHLILPARVIDLGEDQHASSLRLVEPAESQTVNIRHRCEQLDPTELSPTVQDAVAVTRGLGMRYLWVDAVCIVQDDEQDKINQISMMCQIYQNAYVTISAAAASTSNDGFLTVPKESRHRDWYNSVDKWDMSFDLPFWGAEGPGSARFKQRNYMGQNSYYFEYVEPINARAWTFQERLLSQRLIIFASHTTLLQCRRAVRSIDGSLHSPTFPSTELFSQEMVGTYAPGSVHVSADEGINSDAYWKRAAGEHLDGNAISAWQNLTTSYAERICTFPIDKLNALAGLAEGFSTYIDQPYIAGLWAGPALPLLLAWYGNQGLTPGALYEGPYIAPSWSWLNWQGGTVSYFSHMSTSIPFDMDVISASTTLASPELRFGTVTGGCIVLRAHLLKTFTNTGPSFGRAPFLTRVNDDVAGPVACDCPINHGGMTLKFDRGVGHYRDLAEQKIEMYWLPLLKDLQGRDDVLNHVCGLLLRRVKAETLNTFMRIGFFRDIHEKAFSEVARQEVILI